MGSSPATGTSFAAPLVAGVASLLFAAHPAWTAEEVRRVLEQSARDIEIPGTDQYAGFGLLDAKAALAADPRFFVDALITRVAPVQRDSEVFVEIHGTAAADQFATAWVEIGAGENPGSFKRVGSELRSAVADGKLTEISARELAGSTAWTLRLVAEHRNGRRREMRFLLNVG